MTVSGFFGVSWLREQPGRKVIEDIMASMLLNSGHHQRAYDTSGLTPTAPAALNFSGDPRTMAAAYTGYVMSTPALIE